MKPTKYLKNTIVSSHEFDEIDIDLNEEFDFSYDTHENMILHTLEKHRYSNYPIKIERMIDYLSKLKRDGCSHVSIDYHTDHIGYVVMGHVIREMTPEEIESYKFKEKKRCLLKKEYEHKENELIEIENKIRDLEKNTDI